jgi:DNA-binding NarL/FixJ family response regulator
MLTSHSDENEVFASLAAGADAYCMKDIKVDRLHQVLQMVMEGAVWLDPNIAGMVMRALPGQKAPMGVPGPALSTVGPRKSYNTELTHREQEVLELLVAGKSNKEIAVHLNVSTHTAKSRWAGERSTR